MSLAKSVGGMICSYCARLDNLLERLGGRRLLMRSCLVAVLSTTAFTLEACAGFLTVPTYPVGIEPRSVAVGDFNGDGILDLAVANRGSGTVSVLLGNGDGTFQSAHDYAVGSAVCLAVGDFNGDGILDIVTSTGSILLGNGDGTFQTGQSYGSGGISVVVADINGDRVPDLAVANYNDKTVSIFLGNGDGTFQPAGDYSAGREPGSMAVGDFNGDGKLDLAVTNGNTAGTVNVLLGNGDGTFQPAQSYDTATVQPISVAVGDFNGDGIPDLVVVGDHGALVSILLGNGDGTFQGSRTYALKYSPTSVVVADFNGDGHLDLAMTDDAGVTFLLGNGDGTFQAAYSYDAGPVYSFYKVGLSYLLAVGDFNGDGIPDLAVTNRPYSDQGTVSILLGMGHGTFQAAKSYPADGSSVAVSDVNCDGTLDLVVAGELGNAVLLGNGDGTFKAPQPFAGGSKPTSVTLADLNGDGVPDIVTTNFAEVLDGRHGLTILESDVRVLLGNGDGTFGAAQVVVAGTGPVSAAVGDFNGDGIPDLAVANQGIPGKYGSVSVLLGKGDGTFQAAKEYHSGIWYAQSVAVADFDGDGHLDIVVASNDERGNGRVSILLGNGDGSFQAAQPYAVSLSPPTCVAVGDFNADGIPDLAVTILGTRDNGYSDGRVSVLRGNGDGTFQPAQDYPAGNGPRSVAVADFNRDGQLDLAVSNAAWGTVSILLGNGNGTFRAAQTYAVGSNYWVAPGDFNGDGFPDLAFTDSATTVLLNDAHWPP